MSTPAEIFATIGHNIGNNVEKATSTNAVFGFDITGDGGGQWTLNLKQGTTSGFLVDGLAEDANVVISMAAADWTGIISGASNPMQAFMMGKIKVKGDMGLAMKLQNVLALAKG
ncbi:MAG: SCP2 sterol-binding domain-containing protein [Deltaproteobacteria bacterium]|jgi:putative sterol carrier protein|nr:SCP2 sterol-binding domain-containing protein [Deltaproteobacteria bacterium]